MRGEEETRPTGKRLALTVLLSSVILTNAGCPPPEGVKDEKDRKPFEWSEIVLATTPTQTDYPDAAAVFLLKEGEAEITQEGLILHRHCVIKILGEMGKRYAEVKLPFKSGYAELVGIRARTIKPDGSTVEILPGQIHEVTMFPDYVLFADRKANVFAMPGVEENCVIEYFYSEKLKDIRIPSWEFQEEDPVVFSRYSLNIPGSITYRLLKKEPAGVAIQESVYALHADKDSDKRARVEYTCSNLPGIDREPYMPPKPYLTTQILFSPLSVSLSGVDRPLNQSSWGDLSRSYYKIAEPRVDAAGEEMDDLLKNLLADTSTDYDKIKAVYDYLRDAVRYVAVEIGPGNFIPHPADEVLRNKYGDCKDMATLLVALLKKCGIVAYLGLVSPTYEGLVSEDFPSFDQFRHAVACLPAEYVAEHGELTKVLARGPSEDLLDDDYLIVDLTCSKCRFGHLPGYLQGVSVLVTREQGGGLVRTPMTGAGENSVSSFVTLIIDSLGTLNGQVRTTMKGEDAVAARFFLTNLKASEQAEFFSYHLKRDFAGAELLNHECRNIAEVDSPLTIEYGFRVTSLLDMQAEILTFPSGKALWTYDISFSSLERKYPIYFFCRRKTSSYYKIILPERLEVAALPRSVSKSSCLGTFNATFMASGNEVSCVKEFLTEARWIPPEKYQEVREFCDLLSRCEKDNIILSTTQKGD
jgi:hypothetical protein